MFIRIFNQCWATVAVLFLTVVPLGAAEEEPPEWVLSYAIIILFLALTLSILLRPIRRSDSAFSYDEQKAQKEEEMKRIKGGH